MKQQKIISLFFIFITNMMNLSAKNRIDSLLNILDIEIDNYQVYEKKKERTIINLRNRKFEKNFDSEYKHYFDLYNEYNRFCYDSACYYIKKSLEVCTRHNKKEEKIETLTELAHYYAQTGNVVEAYQLLDSFTSVS